MEECSTLTGSSYIQAHTSEHGRSCAGTDGRVVYHLLPRHNCVYLWGEVGTYIDGRVAPRVALFSFTFVVYTASVLAGREV